MNINCPHFQFCSGCTRNTQVANLSLMEEVRDFVKKDVALQVGCPIEWRTRSKLAVRGTSDKPDIGLFMKGTHQVINIPFCKVHHPKINEAVEIVRSWIRTHRVAPYNENSHQGQPRYLQLTLERSSQKIQLVLVSCQPFQKDILDDLWERWNGWHSIWVNINHQKNNVILGTEWRLENGSETLWETICGIDVCFHPSSFAQANLNMFERMIERMKMLMPIQTSLIEYFAEVGAISLALIDHYKQAKCFEINTQAKWCFEQSKQRLTKDHSQKIEFYTGNASDYEKYLEVGESVIVDPPRKGLDHTFRKALIHSKKPLQLFYISCGWEAFKKDYLELTRQTWSLQFAEAYLFFPGTDQIELLTFFTKNT